MLNATLPETCPKVSVLMITYNHEKYIEQAVRSVLMQETDFDFELVVGDDASTDGTTDILENLQREHPNRIRLILNATNQGMISNFIKVMNSCRGDYIALLEGDDFWTSPEKLQRQADILDSEPQCVICFHAVRVLNQSSHPHNKPDVLCQLERTCFGLDDLVFNSKFGIPTASAMLRRITTCLPEWFSRLKGMGDTPVFFYTLQSSNGYIRYLHHEMAVYRLHHGGVWTNASKASFIARKKHMYNDYTILSRNAFDSRCAEHYNQVAFEHIYQLVQYHIRMAELALAWKTAAKLVSTRWIRHHKLVFLKTVVKLLLLTITSAKLHR